MNKETKSIKIGDKVITLSFTPFDTDIDLDDLTSIHYENLFGEIVSVSTLLNKVGILKADMESVVKDHDMELAILKAEKAEHYRKELTRDVPYVRGSGSKTVEPGSGEIESNILIDKAYKIKWKENIRLHKDKEIIDSFYWAIKSKDDKLSVLMKGVTPQEFQSGIIEGVINTIMIKKHKSVM